MRILLIDVNCKYSSTGKLVHDLYSDLNDNKNQAAICYGRGPAIKEPNIFKFGLDWETSIHALLTRLTGYTACFSIISTYRLINYIKKFRPDIVHIHELHAYFVNIKPLLKYLKNKKIPTIVTLHCEFMYTGKCGHSYECNKWKNKCGKCPHLQDYPKTLFFDHTAYMHNQKKILFEDFSNLIVTTPSEWLSNRAKQSFLKSKEILTIHNGVDTSIFYPRDTLFLRQELCLNPDCQVILSVAPDLMNRVKGGMFILKIAAFFPDMHFVMIGVDSEIDTIPNNVTILPRITDQDLLASYYTLASVFVICSEKETFSLTCAEALCCGTPIAGFKCGAPELIFQEPYAKFVEYGDVSSLLLAIKEQSVNYDETIVSYGKTFSKESMLAAYRALYFKKAGCSKCEVEQINAF